jgi:molybdopterin converting factor small subunit
LITIQIVFTGRSYQTSAQLPDTLELRDDAGVGDAIAALRLALGDADSLPSSCLLAVSGEHLGTVENHEPRTLEDGDELVLIAPVAGG